MKKFKYARWVGNTHPTSQQLDDYGQKGFELVNVVPVFNTDPIRNLSVNQYVAYFKKPLDVSD